MKEKIEPEAIIKSLVGVKLTIHMWSASSKRKDLAREIELIKDAEEGSLDAVTHFLSKDVKAKINSAYCQLKGTFEARTLPFRDGGLRVVTAEGFMPLVQALREPMETFNDVCKKEIIDRRDELEQACMLAQRGMFVRFPTKEQLERKYGVDFTSESIAVASDARIQGLSESAMEMVRDQMEKSMQDQIKTAITDIGTRLMSIVDDYEKRLKKPSQSGVRYGGFQKTVSKVCESLAGLNIANDPELLEIIMGIQQNLTKHDPEKIREKDDIRVEQINECKSIRKTLGKAFAGYLGDEVSDKPKAEPKEEEQSSFTME
jgi:hypothetical protein